MKFKILPIAGDASFRKFYRLESNKNSKIIVSATKEKYKNLIAYTAINKFLRKNKILAPKHYTANFPRGIITIEDFGDSSFHNILLKTKIPKNECCNFAKLFVYAKVYLEEDL